MPRRGRLAMSEDILVITTKEEGCYRYLMSGARKAAKQPAVHGTVPYPHAHTMNFPAQNTKVAKLQDHGRREAMEESSIQERAHLPQKLRRWVCTARLPSAPTPPKVRPRSRRPGRSPQTKGPGQPLPASGPAAMTHTTATSF